MLLNFQLLPNWSFNNNLSHRYYNLQTKKNQNFFYQMKNQRHDQVKLFYKPLNDIRLKSYDRTLHKCMSQVIENKDFKLPHVGLNIKDVYSRLFHNEVYLDFNDNSKLSTLSDRKNSMNKSQEDIKKETKKKRTPVRVRRIQGKESILDGLQLLLLPVLEFSVSV